MQLNEIGRKGASEAGSMSPTEGEFIQATDELIALYRNIERRMARLPLLLWNFDFLKIKLTGGDNIFNAPTNILVFIRNLFPGRRWKYRSLFEQSIRRGEIHNLGGLFLFRPLVSLFLKWHFESRLRLLRREVAIDYELSYMVRASLLNRINAAIERWRSPRVVVFFTLILPGILGPLELMDRLGIDVKFGAMPQFPLVEYSYFDLIFFVSLIFYFLLFPITAFIAKRGLFLGVFPDSKILYPGDQGGSGSYSEEREVLGRVGLVAHEMPIDLIISFLTFLFGLVGLCLAPSYYDTESEFVIIFFLVGVAVMVWQIIDVVVAGFYRFSAGRC